MVFLQKQTVQKHALVHSEKIIDNPSLKRRTKRCRIRKSQSHLVLGEREQANILLELLSMTAMRLRSRRSSTLLCKDA